VPSNSFISDWFINSLEFTPRAQSAIKLGTALSQLNNEDFIETQYILIGILSIPDSTILEILKKFQIPTQEIVSNLLIENNITELDFKNELDKTLEEDNNQDKEYPRYSFLETRHNFKDILNEEKINEEKPDDLTNFKFDRQKLISKLYSLRNDLNKLHNEIVTPELDSSGTDLTELAQKDQLDVVVGREKELERIIQILLRRTKNNPILLGDAGVGKTALVEGLAQQIVQKKVPPILQNKRIIMIDLSSLFASTRYRGQFEEKIKKILTEIQNVQNIILFIDEIHAFIGTGIDNTLDITNLLKSFFTRNEFQCIGATSVEKYRKTIEKDSALERRFQKVMIEPTTKQETLTILQQLQPKYEQYHHVHYTEKSLEVAVDLAERYISERAFPDKAIDIIDEAGSKVQATITDYSEKLQALDETYKWLESKKASLELKSKVGITDIEEKIQYINKLLQKNSEDINNIRKYKESFNIESIKNFPLLEQIEKQIQEYTKKLQKLEQEKQEYETIIKSFKQEKVDQEKIIQQNTEELKEINNMLQSIETEKNELLVKQQQSNNEAIVSEDHIREVVSLIVGIPVARIATNEANQLLDMESILQKIVINQNEGIKAIARSLRRSRIGLRDPKRPMGSFIFLGSTGVGKTLLAKSLAKFIFGQEEDLIFIDMSEYMEKYTVSRLIGAAPGYVGYEDGGQLTEKIRRKPYSVILFDEIEKAHPDIYNILLQILDEGCLYDSWGRYIDFKNTIIIMTSNLGANQIKKQNLVGFHSSSISYDVIKETILKETENYFKPEFLNRLDDIIVFQPLSKENIKSILEIELEKLSSRLLSKGYTWTIEEAVKNLIIDQGFNPELGARPLRRSIEQLLEVPLSENFLQGKFNNYNHLTVTYNSTLETIEIIPSNK